MLKYVNSVVPIQWRNQTASGFIKQQEKEQLRAWNHADFQIRQLEKQNKQQQ